MKLFGDDTVLTPIAKLIMDEDIDTLEQEICNGWDINKVFNVCTHIDELPINLALYYNKLKVVDLLLQHNVELNSKDAAVPTAADECSIDTIKLLIKHGANINSTNRVGSTAIDRALINNRIDLMKELIEIGINLKKNGTILRSAVFKNNIQAVRLLLDNNIDVNYHKANMVFPNNPTAVHVAAKINDFETLKLLVEHGADVTIKDSYGERPYLAAKENNNKEMMNYLKLIEPKEWHNEEEKLIELKSYKLPKSLVEFLRGKNLRMDIKDNEFATFIEFYSLIDCKEVKWKGYKFLDLISNTDKYDPAGFLVWYPKGKCLAYADYEHEQFKTLDKWEDFISNPSQTINKIFD